MNDESAYQALLREICVDLGFCGQVVNGKARHVGEFIPDRGKVTAVQFVEWIFVAEGVDPRGPTAMRVRESLREKFLRHMGAYVVDARMLK